MWCRVFFVLAGGGRSHPPLPSPPLLDDFDFISKSSCLLESALSGGINNLYYVARVLAFQHVLVAGTATRGIGCVIQGFPLQHYTQYTLDTHIHYRNVSELSRSGKCPLKIVSFFSGKNHIVTVTINSRRLSGP